MWILGRVVSWYRSHVLCVALTAVLLSLKPDPSSTLPDAVSMKCVEITIPMCRGIGYNYTYTPNQFHHDTQEEAGLEVHQFWPLVEIQCSPELRFFLCSMYAPICMTNYNRPLPVCRSVCERAKMGCAPLMRQYGFAWPERMACDQLPMYGDNDRLCMQFNGGPTRRPTTVVATKYGQYTLGTPRAAVNALPAAAAASKASHPAIGASPGKNCSCRCRWPFVNIRNVSITPPPRDQLTAGDRHNCAMPCDGFYSAEQKQFAQFWLGLWAILCLVSSSATVLTFLIDTRRFSYPERPIVYLIACYAMLSIGYVIRLAVGHDVMACEQIGDRRIVRYESSSAPIACNAVFLLVYFFGMAANVWWVILSFTWFLTAGLKWGREAVEGLSHYFHLAAWLIPSVQTIAILALSSVDGDPVSGICYVGNQSINNLRGFVIAPLCANLFLGTFFLVAGFVSLVRIRRAIRDAGLARTDKLDKFIFRVGIFSLLHTVPSTSVVVCFLYEHQVRLRLESEDVNCSCSIDPVTPIYSVLMFKYFMCLIVGITSGFWIWTGKTVDSWRQFYWRVTGRSRHGGRNGTRKINNGDDEVDRLERLRCNPSDYHLGRCSKELPRKQPVLCRI